jgi:nicotinamidase/pyrazinamidase
VKLAKLFEYVPHGLSGSMDWHDTDCKEFDAHGGPFPPHCLKESFGSHIIPELDMHISGLFTKDSYDVFTNERADRYFSDPKMASAIFVAGVATEFCVLAAAEGLLDRGHQVILVEDAIMGIKEEDAQASIEQLKRHGAMTCKTDQVKDLREFILHFGKASGESVLRAMKQVEVTL